MAPDTSKHLERARRSLEKNRLREAIAEYQAVLEEMRGNQEALQALADIYTRLNEPALAAQYYGAQFDRLLDVGDAAKASAIFTRFLRPFPQPPDRLLRYGTLLQKQNRPSEAIEQFATASEIFQQQQRSIEAMACCESLAVLDPDNPQRHIALGEMAERLRHADLAARSYLRAGQLTQTTGGLDEALGFFERAYRLLPADRNCALIFAEAKLRKGDHEGAVSILEPFAPGDKDTAFLALLGEGLLRTGQLDRARDTLLAFYKLKPVSFSKLFELVGAYIRAGEDEKASALLLQVKDAMRDVRKESELSSQMDRLAAANPASLPLAETVARIYEELNRETKYFDALVQLFDLYLVAGKMKEACETLDRLVDIDPYDYRNQERIGKLEGNVDPSFLQNVLSRVAKAATVSTRTDGFSGAGSGAGSTAGPVSEEVRAQQALEDLVVQVEIFLQYSLHTKAVERLEKISELFPGEESKNDRLRALYERANWWPKGAVRTPPVPAAPVASPPRVEAPAPAAVPSLPAETHRDLAKIAEINRTMYRQRMPRDVLVATAHETGKYLHLTRCLIAVGEDGQSTPLTAEFCATGVTPTDVARIPSIVAMVKNASPDALGGIELRASEIPGLRELGLETALAVELVDKETQASSGALLVGSATDRKWKSNESFFLQAVGDQLVLSINHTRLRSLVRSLAVTDEKTGLLNRGSYIDCLLVESNRARTQGTTVSLVMLQIDRGSELLNQYGDKAFDQYIDQLAQTLSSAVRQTDIAVKYTAWSLAFILPDTSLENARSLAEKLHRIALTVPPSWGAQNMTASAIIAEASSRPDDDTEDRVTEWINRIETGLDDARERGGNVLVPLATP